MAEKHKNDKVTPKVLKGFRDYQPEEEIARADLIEKARTVVERFGFLPIQTPSLEFAETLLGGDYTSDNLKELFGFEGPEQVAMALRYEFTVSLARYVAARPQLTLPFRRYQYGNVWRVDKPGPGRFREFTQFDFDIVGTASMLADAEIISVMTGILEQLGIERYLVRFSNRKLLNGLTAYAGIPPEQAPDVFRVIDKLEKQGREAVVLELGPGRIDISGDKIPGLHLTDDQVKQITDFLDIAEKPGDDILERAQELLGNIETSRRGIDELRQVNGYLADLGISGEKTQIDITIVRGLGYYTGPVYETTLTDLPEYGSVISGGRYDNMIHRFSNRQVPAVGSSFGVDRMLAALVALNTRELKSATADVIVTTMDKDRLTDYLAMVREIRNAGINAELYLGETKNINKQLKYADKIGIPVAVIAGSDEFANGMVTVKDLRAGSAKSEEVADRKEWLKADEIQVTIKRKELISQIKKLLTLHAS
ncbi:MAG: histidine--tRNA ligase [candidate division Zixibacteria bacterium]|nr:histidine--tRNA ligase [candidate division Zixibacteria bacterium]